MFAAASQASLMDGLRASCNDGTRRDVEIEPPRTSKRSPAVRASHYPSNGISGCFCAASECLPSGMKLPRLVYKAYKAVRGCKRPEMQQRDFFTSRSHIRCCFGARMCSRAALLCCQDKPIDRKLGSRDVRHSRIAAKETKVGSSPSNPVVNKPALFGPQSGCFSVVFPMTMRKVGGVELCSGLKLDPFPWVFLEYVQGRWRCGYKRRYCRWCIRSNWGLRKTASDDLDSS